MSDYRVAYFTTHRDPPIQLQLGRWLDDSSASLDGRTPVLLLHGASANHGTFTVVDTSLAPWLAGLGFDPWLLDWRGSSLVVEDPENKASLDRQEAYNINRAADEDLPGAIRYMRSVRGIDVPIA